MIVHMILSWWLVQGEQGAKGVKGQSGSDGFQVSQSDYLLNVWIGVDCILNRGELGHEALWAQKDKEWV